MAQFIWGCPGFDRIRKAKTASRWQSLNASVKITGNNNRLAFAA